MILREIFSGPAGSGKTHACLNLFADALSRDPLSGASAESFYILPNREHADRILDLLASDPRLKGIAGVRVLTIADFIRYKTVRPGERLATQFDRREWISSLLRKDAGDWKDWLRDAALRPGTAKLFSGFLRELSHTAMGLEECARLFLKQSEKPAPESAKYRELARLIERYQKRLESAGWVDAESLLRRFTEEDSCPAAMDLVIWDGFFGFTEAQLRFLVKTASSAGRTVVTLTLDPRRASAFYYPIRMRERLKERGFVEVAFEGPSPRFLNPGLQRIESRLFIPGELAGEAPSQEPAEPLLLFEAPDRGTEIRMIAREILKNRAERRIAYADQMLVVRSIRPYEALVRDVFDEMGIPVAIHERRRLTDHPVSRLLVAWTCWVLSGVPKEDAAQLHAVKLWPGRELIQWLRWELRLAGRANESLGFSDESLFEDRELSLEEFTAACESLLPAESRFTVKNTMDRLKRFESIQTGREWTRFFKDFLGEAAAAWRPPRSLSSGTADWDRVLKILEKEVADASAALDLRSVTVCEAAGRIRDAVEMGLYSSGRSSADTVQVYDAVLALPKEYRVVFVAGLSQEQFPQRHSEHPILKDLEREALREEGLWLDSAGDKARGERYFFYMAVTRARERLILSRPVMDAEGRPALPSVFWEEILRTQKAGGMIWRRAEPEEPVSPPGEWRTLHDAALGLARGYALGDAPLKEISRKVFGFAGPKAEETAPPWGASRERSEAFFAGIAAAGRLRPGDLGSRVIRLSEQAFSATALEDLENCSYQYFAKRWLKLSRWEKSSPEMLEGSLLHLAFEKGIRALAGQMKSGFPSESEWTEAICGALEKEWSEDSFGGETLADRVWRRDRIRRMALAAARFEWKRLKARTGFTPAYFEYEFGGPSPLSESVWIQTERGRIRLKGKIDRIDLDLARGLGIVVDYKRSKPARWNAKHPDEISFQPVIYGLALEQALRVHAANVEWVSLKDCVSGSILRSVSDPKKQKDAEESEKLDAFSGPEWTQTVHAVGQRIAGALERMKTEGAAADGKSCKNCAYPSVCRFEGWRLRE